MESLVIQQTSLTANWNSCFIVANSFRKLSYVQGHAVSGACGGVSLPPQKITRGGLDFGGNSPYLSNQTK